MPLNAIKNYVKEELPGIYEAGKFIRDRAEDFNENREQVIEGRIQELEGEDSTQINEEVRPIGSEAVLNGQPVFWSGQNYGWQSKGSFDKLMDEGQFRMGGIAAQRFGNSITEAIPQEVKDFATEKITEAAVAGKGWYDSQSYENKRRYINPALNIANGVVTLADQGLEFISEKTNTSRFITDELAMAALTAGGSAAVRRATPAIKQGAKTAIKAIDKYGPTIDNIFPPTPPAALATAGAAPRVQLNVSGGKANLTPQVMELTVDPKFRAPGMVEGVAQQPEFRDALDRRTVALKEVRANIDRRIAEGKPPSKYIKEEAGKGSTLDYNPNDVIVFEKKRYKVYDPLDPQRYAQQHHLFAKAQSYPFVEKMEDLIAKGIADEDDLVAMFAWADMLDVTMGNTRKNMLDAPGRSHIDAAVGATEFDKTRNIHTVLKDFNLELTRKQVSKIVADAKDATDLMERFNNYIVESVKPQKKVAQRIVEDFLVRHRASLPTEQLAMFDDLSSKLGGRIQR